jgi:hypothetical protein
MSPQLKESNVSTYPVDAAARARLRKAQQSEARALKAVGVAAKARQHAQARLDQADAALATAHVELVAISGVWRAALLTDEPVKVLRRLAHQAGLREDGSKEASAKWDAGAQATTSPDSVDEVQPDRP